MAVVVYAYGVPSRELPPEVDEQLRLAHDLRIPALVVSLTSSRP